MPPPASQVDWEMALVMPLGALANRLVKIETDLRFLSMKAAEHAGEDGTRPTRVVDARLELIHESLDAIKVLLDRLQSDLHPRPPAARPQPLASTERRPSSNHPNRTTEANGRAAARGDAVDCAFVVAARRNTNGQNQRTAEKQGRLLRGENFKKPLEQIAVTSCFNW